MSSALGRLGFWALCPGPSCLDPHSAHGFLVLLLVRPIRLRGRRVAVSSWRSPVAAFPPRFSPANLPGACQTGRRQRCVFPGRRQRPATVPVLACAPAWPACVPLQPSDRFSVAGVVADPSRRSRPSEGPARFSSRTVFPPSSCSCSRSAVGVTDPWSLSVEVPCRTVVVARLGCPAVPSRFPWRFLPPCVRRCRLALLSPRLLVWPARAVSGPRGPASPSPRLRAMTPFRDMALKQCTKTQARATFRRVDSR